MANQSHINNLPPEVIIYGGTGQAKVIRPIIEHYGSKVIAVFDDTPRFQSPFPDVRIYHGYEELLQWAKENNHDQTGFCIAIGNPHGRVRLRLHDNLIKDGFRPITIAHPTSWIADNATIDHGSQVMAGAVIMPEVRIGVQCIINTNASVDHECLIEDGSEIAPGATVCGCVQLGTNSWVCAGSTILPRIRIGEDSIVGAGAVVTHDVPPQTTVVGIPAKKKKGGE